MIRSFRTLLFLSLFVASVSPPAQARLVVGVTPAVMPGTADPATVAALEQELTSRMGEAVKVRSFDSEATQIDWLIRFRELDAALVSRHQVSALPAGTMLILTDISPAVAVSHPGMAAGQIEVLQRGFRSLAEDDRGRRLLHRLTGNVKSAVAAKPAPMAPATKAKPAAIAPVAIASAPAAPKPAVSSPPPAPATPSVKPAIAPVAIAPAPAAPKPAVSSPPPAPAAPSVKPAVAPAPAPSRPQAPLLKPRPAEPPAAATPPATETASPKRTRLLLIAALVVLIGIGVKVMLLMRQWKQHRQVPEAPPRPPSAETFGYRDADAASTPAPMTATPVQVQVQAPPPPAPALATAATATGAAAAPGTASGVAATSPAKPDAVQPVVLRVNMGTKGKVNFDFRTPTPAVTQASAAPLSTPAPEAPAATAEAPTKGSSAPRRKTAAGKGGSGPLPPATADLVVEQGRLGRTKVPALLKRCADLPQPVILRVRTQENEICVHFAAGQICHAYSRDWRVAGESRQWSKLCYLMVREGLMVEAQRDQALELIERQQGLRLPAALQQLGLLDVEALRHILARQARTTLFALILFPVGDYSIVADTGAIPAEESISLQVEELIREASQHQAEWTAIRKVLPTLDTRLDFAPDGREKLGQVRLSVHQQLLLSQVDGQTTLGTLCNASTMMDYEVSRFLYLMVKAGVLQVC